jgi:ABC-2 type transport system permease protein
MLIIKGVFFKNMSPDDVFINLIPIAAVAVMTLSLANWMFKKKLD